MSEHNKETFSSNTLSSPKDKHFVLKYGIKEDIDELKKEIDVLSSDLRDLHDTVRVYGYVLIFTIISLAGLFILITTGG